MAAETLHQLHGDERFDLVVVDTPPSRNALDFLEAPGVLARFLDHRLFRLLMLPARRGMRLVNGGHPAAAAGDRPGRRVRRARRRRGVLPGVRRHGGGVPRSGPRPSSASCDPTPRATCIVASPHRDTVDRGGVVRRAARRAGHRADRRRRQPGASRRSGRARRPRPRQRPRRPGDADVAALWRNVADLRALAEAARDELAPFAELLGDAPLVEVPLLAGDVHDLDGLGEIRRHLFAAP